MQPQFVDFNADGHIDIFTATFGGSPWVAYGTGKGFKQPEIIKDKDGNDVILSYYWDTKERKWTALDRTDGKGGKAHCISAFAFDWNGNGAFDLVLGDREGRLWLQMNEGTNKEPKFAGVSTLVMSGDKPLSLGDKGTAHRLLDWDGDGLADIVAGTFGDAYQAGKGGGIVWFKNVGKKGEPKFESPQTLIEFSAKDGADGDRPDAGLYFDVIDMNGDGKLDLVVGGYSMAKDANVKSRGGMSRKPYVWLYTQTSAKPDIER